MINRIEDLLGSQHKALLSHQCKTISRERLHLPGSDFIDRVMRETDRSAAVLRNLGLLHNTGRLRGTGYVSILPVDQGIEHSAGASFAPNPEFFDPSAICELAIEGGCNAVATTYGVLAAVARRYAHKIPFILKINHNEMLTMPNRYDQTLFASVDQAFDMGCVGVGATIYWGADNCRQELQEISEVFAQAHDLGMFTVLWCYLRNSGFKKDGIDYHASG
jgi:class I fructose-bisphosphate aldolase